MKMRSHYGFSAQEVNKVFPEVSQWDDITDTYGIDSIGLAALAIKGLKELNEKLNDEIVGLQCELLFIRKQLKYGKTSNN